MTDLDHRNQKPTSSDAQFAKKHHAKETKARKAAVLKSARRSSSGLVERKNCGATTSADRSPTFGIIHTVASPGGTL